MSLLPHLAEEGGTGYLLPVFHYLKSCTIIQFRYHHTAAEHSPRHSREGGNPESIIANEVKQSLRLYLRHPL